jgi:chromosome segregation ATPase
MPQFNRLNAAGTKKLMYFFDSGRGSMNGCYAPRPKLKPDYVEEIVFSAMKKRLESLEIAKHEQEKPDKTVDKLQGEIIKLDEEIRKLLDKLADANTVLFDYIQGRVKTLHAKKSELEEKLRNKSRKHKTIDTSPLSDPMSRWETLTIEEKHTLAVTMIDVIYVSDEDGIDIRFAI